MFYERFITLCSEHGTTPTAVAKNLGISTSKPTAWKNGTVPNLELAFQVAKYFNVTVDYFVRDASQGELEISSYELELLFKLRSLPPDKRKALEVLLG